MKSRYSARDHQTKTQPGRELTEDEVQTLVNACLRLRDRLLLALLYETGMSIGQALGLRHEDIRVEDAEIRIVDRGPDPNCTRLAYVLPGVPPLMGLYVDFLISDLNALEVDSLPEYVFVTLRGGELGPPMTYESVRSLFRRLRNRTGIRATPYMFRKIPAGVLWMPRDVKR